MARLDKSFDLGDFDIPFMVEIEQSILEAELSLQNSSLAYEYLRLSLESCKNEEESEACLYQMESYKKAYFSARYLLEEYNPLRLKEVEEDLVLQKQQFFGAYHA